MAWSTRCVKVLLPRFTDMDWSQHLEEVQTAIGYRFEQADHLSEALTHSSYASENDVDSYERLEFLGDAVLELAVTERLFAALADASEGTMTRIRATIVDEASLASAARTHGLASSIRLGVGEDRNGGRDRSSIQSDVVESILGAVYVDGGSTAAFSVVDRLLGASIAERLSVPFAADPRSELQERIAGQGKEAVFAYARTGPDHAVVFTATVSVDDDVIGSGTGASKKSAAIDAARTALQAGFVD